MDLVTLKAFFQTKIGSKTAAGSIYPVDITDCLDALADAVDAGDIGGGGAVAPSIVSATCPNGAANTVVVVFNQSMTAVTTAGWSFKKNGSAWSVSSVTGATTTWTFTMGSSAINGDTLLRSYDSTTGATIGTSLELVSFTDSAVTNSVGAVAPTVVSATCPDGAANTVVVVFDQSMTGVTTAGWSFKINGGAWAVSSVTGATTTWTFTMGSSAVFGDTLLRSYDSTTGATIGTSLELVSFTDSSVTNSIAGSGYQTESDTFFASNTGLSTPQKDALDALVVAMKGIGWSKFTAVYPFIGGSAAAHKWNLVNPADTDGAFRGVFAGTGTHNSSGYAGNGTTGYMDTKLIPSVDLSVNDAHFGIYFTAAGGGSANGRHGCESSATANNLLIGAGLSGSSYYRMWGTANDGQIAVTQADVTDFFLMTRRGASDMEAYKASTSVQTNSGSTGVGGLPVSRSVYVGAHNEDGTAAYFSDLGMGLVTMGTGLTDGEVSTYYTAIQAYQTALSRNV